MRRFKESVEMGRPSQAPGTVVPPDLGCENLKLFTAENWGRRFELCSEPQTDDTQGPAILVEYTDKNDGPPRFSQLRNEQGSG